MITPLELIILPEGSARWSLVLLTIALKSGVLLLAALLLIRLLRGASAALRHLVLSLSLAAALVLPALSAVVPLWPVPVLPADLAPYAAEPEPVAVERGEFGAAAVPLLLEPLPERTPVSPPSPPAGEGEAPFVPPTPSAIAATDAERPAAPAHWLVFLLYVWLAGAGLLLLRLGAGMLRLRALARRAEPLVDPGWTELAQRLTHRLGLFQPVQLRRCEVEVVPMVWGAFRPVILLPATAEEWTEERRTVVLLHEMSHVKRWDPLAHLIAQLCHIAYWFNPLVWMAARRLREERERACDDHVLAVGTDPAEYANHLLQIVRAFGRGPAAEPALAMARRSQFEGRLLAILDPGLRRTRISPPAAGLAATVTLCAALPLAALSPVVHPADLERAPEQRSAVVDSVPALVQAIALKYRVPEELASAVVHAARAEGLEVGLAVLLVRIESGFREDLVSPGGAVGLTQMLPATAASLEPGITAEELAERGTNLRLGFRYLRHLLDRYQGDAAAALTAYHAGPRVADQLRAAAGVPPAAPPAPPAPPAAARVQIGSREETGPGDIERMVRMIDSDGGRAMLLIQTLSHPLPHDQLLGVVRASEQIGSDGDRHRVLATVLARPGLGQQALEAVLHAAAGIDSDGDKAAVLLNFLDRHRLSASLTPMFFEAANSLGSAGDHGRVLHRVLERNAPGVALLERLLDSAARIDSDGEKANLLVAIASRGVMSQALQARYLAAVETIDSEGERQRALVALSGGARSTPQPANGGSDKSGWTTELNYTHEVDHVKTQVAVRARNVVLRRDGAGLDSIRAGGLLFIEETGAAATRSLTVAPAPGAQLSYRYLVDGQVRAFDGPARSWLAGRLRQIHETMKGQTRI